MANEWLTNIWHGVGQDTGLFDLWDGIKAGDVKQIQQGTNKLRLGPAQYLEDRNSTLEGMAKANTSYSGSDATVFAIVNDVVIVLGNVATFSYSIFREKAPVRVLGRSHAKGYTSGGRTISGSFVFIVFDRNPLYDVIEQFKHVGKPGDRYSSPVPDQLPPIDLILLFDNEYGHSSIMRLYGVEFIQEGQVHSVNDLYSENTMQYVARDIDQLINANDVGLFKDMMFQRQLGGTYIDNHLASLLEYKKDIERRLSVLNNEIEALEVERGRIGVATLGIALTTSWLGGRTVMNIEEELRTKYKLKTLLLSEVMKIDDTIRRYEIGVVGGNAQRSVDSGVAAKDDLRQRNVNQTRVEQ